MAKTKPQTQPQNTANKTAELSKRAVETVQPKAKVSQNVSRETISVTYNTNINI